MNSNPTFSQEQLFNARIPGEETGIEIKKTVCSVCYNNCQINAYVKDGKVIKVEGATENPYSNGTLCAKGAANRQYIYNPERLRSPLLRKGEKGSGEFEPISWDDAYEIISSRLLKIREESGPESTVFFCGYPKWLRPFLKRMAHSYGSPNYCTESSVCFFSTYLAGKLNYGDVTVPDMSKTNCLLVWSNNPFHSGTPKAGKLLKTVKNGAKLIEVSPMITPLTGHTDIHLRLRPGTCGALASGMANIIIREGLYDQEFVEKWTVGFEKYRDYVSEFTPEATGRITGIDPDLIVKAAKLYGSTKPAAMLNGASPTVHHTNGLQNHRALTALIGLTGNFDVEGGNQVVPHSYYHLPTGLVTREPEFEQVRAWEDMAPRMGQDKYPVWCKHIPEAQSMHLPFQIRSKKPYPIRAMLGFGLNYRMWPGSDFMKESLKMLDFLVVTDLFNTDTAKLADLALPACSSFERSEIKVWVPRYGMWTKPAIDPVGESRSDIDIMLDLSRKMNLDDPLMREGYEACVDWMFEPAGVKVSDFDNHPEGCFIQNQEPVPYRKYEKEGFNTPSGKMEFYSSTLEEAGQDPLPTYKEPELSPISTPDVAKKYPLVFNTGARIPMFMHSRAFRLPWMRALRPDPMVDINPVDAEKRNLCQGDEVYLATSRNRIRVKANLTERVSVGVVGMFHGYPEADVNLLIEPDYLDPVSGYPGFKSLLCEVEKATD